MLLSAPRRFIRSIRFFTSALLLAAVAGTGATQAQLARKPSGYEAQERTKQRPDESFAPRPQMPASGAQSAPAGGKAVHALAALTSRAAFDSFARIYDAGTPMELAHSLFVIDRQAGPPRIYYLDTPRYELHVRFVRETGLAPNAGKRAIDRNYLEPNRRFMFGTLSWQKNIAAFTYEFWEGDQLTPALLAETEKIVKASFFAPISFKTNSTQHERVAREAGLAYVTQEALIREQPFLPLNLGKASGRLRIVAGSASLNGLLPDDIAVLQQVPINLPPVAGVLTEKPSTALSHVNLLAKGWGIPNAYLRDAVNVLRAREGQWVELQVEASGYRLRPLTEAEIAERQARPAAIVVKRPMTRPDLRETRLKPLATLRTANSAQCGAKAANLGAVLAARIPAVEVPDGFCIPFAHYARFMAANGLAGKLAALQREPGFADDPRVREQALGKLRAEIVQWPVAAETSAGWAARWQSQLGGKGVFVRSSSNSEDLPGFSGAGLYSTVPNVKNAEALTLAVKTVWASVFNAEAWEARRAAGFAPDDVAMAVLVQSAVDSVNAGVMITRDPFDPSQRYSTYISAKRGIGIRVVEGQRVAEQVIYSSWSKAIQVISRSADDTALQLDPNGGVKAMPVAAGHLVLSDDLVLRLARTGAAVKRVFRGVEQDIEWATLDDRIVVLQARPYIDRHGAR
jgi:hypothetical protein